MGSIETMILDPRKTKREVENISSLITHGNILDLKISAKHLFLIKVVINLHIFCSSMKNGIWCNCKGRDIVTPEFGRWGKENTKIFQHLSKPWKLSCNEGQCSILRLNRRYRNSFLLLGTPSNGVVTKVDHITSDWMPIIRITCPIRIRKGWKGDWFRLKKHL